jgi:hypothetical protein
MYRIYFLVFFLLATITITAQSVEGYLKEGIGYHDDGDYDLAISAYQKALELDPKSALANYEIAMTYFQTGDHKNALKYSSKALKVKNDNPVPAIVIKGSALDMLGKTEKSIEFLEKAIAEHEPYYLLHYNTALNYYKLNDNVNASRHCLEAIAINTSHASSYYLLSSSEARRDHPTQSLLATYFFLFLEPESFRSKDAYQLMMNQLSVGGDKSAGPTETNITLNLNSEFATADMLVKMFGATRKTDLNKDLTEDELFIKNTGTLFSIIGEQRETNETENIWWDFYIPFFFDIEKSGHLEAFCKYITQGENEASYRWLEENQDKVQAFADWLDKE